MSLLRVEDITSGYGEIDVLFDVSLRIEEGDIVSIIGPNGAGKSTLLKTIVGVLSPRKGQIFFNDQDVTHWQTDRLIRNGMSWVPQDNQIFPSLTVDENLDVGAYTQRGNIEERLKEVLSIFPQLRERGRQVAGSMSGGQQQMVAVGRGLMSRPDLLLLDEPTAGLAPNLVDEMLNKIRAINEAGVTVLLVAQNLEALEFSQRGYLLSAGKITFEGSTEELLENPQVRELYFGL